MSYPDVDELSKDRGMGPPDVPEAAADPGGEATPAFRPGGRITLKVPTLPEYYRLSRLLVSGLSQSMGLHPEVVEDVKLAVSEACVLVCGQGEIPEDGVPTDAMPINPDGVLFLEIGVGEAYLEIRLEGPPGIAEVSKSEDAETSADEYAAAGLGLFFIQSLMDEVQYTVRNGAACVRMVKTLHPEGEEEL